jgi:hypothetical protein
MSRRGRDFLSIFGSLGASPPKLAAGFRGEEAVDVDVTEAGIAPVPIING